MTPQEIGAWLKKLDDFEKMTPHIYQDYKNWRLETDLECIEVRGRIIPTQFATYIEYFEWRLGIDELNNLQLQQADIEEFTAYEEVE